MRLLVATFHAEVVGGAERYLQAVLPALRARGHEVALVVEHFGLPEVEHLDDHPPAGIVSRDGAGAVLRAARDFGPDVLWVHGLEAPAFEAALLDVAPAALFAHGYYGTCGTGHKRFAWPDWRPCDRRLGPSCLALTWARRCGGLDPLRTLRTYDDQRARQRLLSRYRVVMVASRHMAEEFRRHGVAEDRLAVTPPPPTGATPALVAPAPTPRSGPIVFMGRMVPEKGARHLLDAVATAGYTLGWRPPLRLVGDGPQRPALLDHARALGLDAEFPGWLRGADRFAVLTGASLLAMPSLWPEPFGLAGIEAGAFGVPAVAYAVGGIPEWLRPGESGELAPSPPRVAGLADAIVRALRDPAHHARLAAGAWTLARTWAMPRHLEALEAALARAAGASA